MSRLESLPLELREMIIDECSPRDLLALISASPAYLRDFSKGRTRILNKYIDPMIMGRSHHPIDLALSIAKVQAARKQLAGHDPRMRSQVLVDYLRDALEGDPDRRSRSLLLERLPLLIHVHELRDEARRLALRLEPEVLSTIQSLGSSRHHPPHPILRRWEDLGVEKGVLIFEMYCLSLDISDGEVAREVSTYWYPHFRVRHGAWARPNHDLFYVVFNQVLQEHMRIVREVARDLHITVIPDIETDTPATNEEDKQAQTKEESTGMARRSSQIQLLDKRSVMGEYSYCRYLTSLGMGLMNQLEEMTPEEQRDYTLAMFSWVCEMRKGLAWRAAPSGLLFI